ncbi:hypothetical protein LIER_24068 [Lithospermum erythrorhizon]|uniref:Uncharacterized protein n=1 Tax=Lithospermum erythrorhizon TaxID=34254 RepID=A0AAV3QZU2_LITER
MDGQIRVIFCKYCGQRAVMGGWSGMMLESHLKLGKKRSSMERISCLERMLFDVEENVRQLKHEKGGLLDENLVLKKELDKQQMYTKCLKKCVNALLFLLCLAAIFTINCGSNDDVEAI